MPYIAPCSNPVTTSTRSTRPASPSQRCNLSHRAISATAAMTNGKSNNSNKNNSNSSRLISSPLSNDSFNYFSSKLSTNQPQGGSSRLIPESPASSDDTNFNFSSSASSSTSSIENDYGELKKAVEAMVVVPPTSSYSKPFSSKALLKKSSSSSSALSTLVLTTPTASRSTTTLLANDTNQTPISSITSSPSNSVPSSPSNIVRKKSGERVKSSLKLPSLVRHQSMPATSKMVHFDVNLERVCHYLNSEKPTAVSTQSSPIEERAKFHWGTDSDHDTESSEDEEEEDPRIGFQNYLDRTEWQISLPNFTQNFNLESSKTVFLESVFLSGDKNNLFGNVAVKNLTFEKYVIIRYSLDNWKTATEISAEYNPDVRRKLKVLGYDRFTFSLNLRDFPQLYTNSVLLFCVKFVDGNGGIYWDNNNGHNYKVIFTCVNKIKPVNNNRLPVRSHVTSNNKVVNTHRRSKSSQNLMGRSSYDDEEDDEIFTRLLRKPKLKTNSPDHFTSRYDFGSSFSNNNNTARNANTGVLTSNWHANASGSSTKPGEEFALNAKSYQELIDSYCFFKGSNSKPGSAGPVVAKTSSKSIAENTPTSSSPSSPSSSSSFNTPSLHSYTLKTAAPPVPSITINSSSSSKEKGSTFKNGSPTANAAVGPKSLMKEHRLTVI